MCDRCEYEQYVEELEDMLNNDNYNWAEETLSGIYVWVLDNDHITDRQRDLFIKIKESV